METVTGLIIVIAVLVIVIAVGIIVSNRQTAKRIDELEYEAQSRRTGPLGKS